MSRADEEVRVVLVTAPDSEVGAELARAVVEAKLAACVNLLPQVRSIYRWEGAVQDGAEVMLVIKTRAGRCQELAARLQEIHPYDLPEVLVLPVVGGSQAYLRWVVAETRP